ncbi:AMP-binding protein [Pseudooceanicola sp. 216_PA32_1]|uniref:3-methylmercaptopropionyl-CoA ligase n=1 Tax=Pseudooceanicola pacificus TaxID=2676438 RepID=A0A844WE30_9RHOB|nr:AMP-binding protein [Pseudooceanicola pacificus]MWB78090.1 AMP-binding protein [Pseudooceanicola pacificus]
MNPAEWLARTARARPGAPALLKGHEVVADYAAFARQAAGLGAALVERGIRPGDRVAIFLPNTIEYLPIFFGILWAGATTVPINGKLHAREAAWIVSHSGAKIVLARDAGLDRECSATRIDPADPAFAAMLAHAPLDQPVALAPDDPAWLFYTSGTTGRPKGAVLSCGNLLAMSMSYLADVDEVGADDAALYAAPMSHGAGLYNLIHVLRGARHVVPVSGGFDPAEIFDLAAGLGNVSMFAAPTMVKRMVDHARRSGDTGTGIKTIVYGGGPMYVSDILGALDLFGPKFVQIYGQGEAPMTITALSRADIADSAHPDWRRRLASVGRAHSVAEVRILDAEGNPLPVGEVGEIAVRGPQVMQGYLNDPEASAKALRDGWLLTGDLGHLDADGYLTLHDRARDMIVSGGSNIYPREVEEVLLTHPEVSEASVVGMADPEWGEIVIAFVVASGARPPETADLDALCVGSIARFKKPKRYVFVTELPKNNYGKVLKTDLRARLEAPAASDTAPADS